MMLATAQAFPVVGTGSDVTHYPSFTPLRRYPIDGDARSISGNETGDDNIAAMRTDLQALRDKNTRLLAENEQLTHFKSHGNLWSIRVPALIEKYSKSGAMSYKRGRHEYAHRLHERFRPLDWAAVPVSLIRW
jgi:hypothetical protein